jgi:hypothetical protein
MEKNQPMKSKAFRVGGNGMCDEVDEEKASKNKKKARIDPRMD